MKRLVARFAGAAFFVALAAVLVVVPVIVPVMPLSGMGGTVSFAAGLAGAGSSGAVPSGAGSAVGMAGAVDVVAGGDGGGAGWPGESGESGKLRGSRESRQPDASRRALLVASAAQSPQSQSHPQSQSQSQSPGSPLDLPPVSHASPAPRPPQWAQPVPGVHIKNLYRITPTLYRSAQPTADDIAGLRALGIRKIVSLRAFHRDDKLFARSGLVLQRIPVNTWSIRDADMIAALKALRDTRRDGPVLLHCQHGADRTGVVSALYRMVYQGWTRQQAIDELRNGGYGYNTIWINILHYLERVDVEKLRREVGVTAGTTGAPDARG